MITARGEMTQKLSAIGHCQSAFNNEQKCLDITNVKPFKLKTNGLNYVGNNKQITVTIELKSPDCVGQTLKHNVALIKMYAGAKPYPNKDYSVTVHQKKTFKKSFNELNSSE